MTESRPTQLGITSGDIRDAAGITETADHWHVYLKEWLIMARGETAEEAEVLFERRWKGRVEHEDMRYGVVWSAPLGIDSEPQAIEVHLRLWNLVSAWTSREDAEAYVGEDMPEHDKAGNVRIVGRNTKEEVMLKDYGRKLLPGRVLRGGVVQ